MDSSIAADSSTSSDSRHSASLKSLHWSDVGDLRHEDTNIDDEWVLIPSSSRGPFRHMPLDTTRRSVRLLKVLPSKRGSTVKCSLFHTTIDGSYDCLSYRWGNDTPSKNIVINGMTYFVRENLYQFLIVAQSTAELHAPIWIDAICIDQDNAEEKNHQVQQMGQLYANAKTVHIWLGPATYQQHEIFAYMAQSKSPSVAGKLHRSFSSPQKSKVLKEISEADRIKLAQDIAYNSYWLRAWIVQEVSLARTKSVWFGYQRVEWLTFRGMFLPLVLEPTSETDYAEPELLHDSPLATFVRTSKPEQGWRKQPLYELLQIYSHGLQCSDPRDRVYCLLSLAALRTKLSADYTLSIRDVFFLALYECTASGCMCATRTLIKLFGDQFAPQV